MNYSTQKSNNKKKKYIKPRNCLEFGNRIQNNKVNFILYKPRQERQTSTMENRT